MMSRQVLAQTRDSSSTRTMTDAYDGTLSMEFDDKVARFNIFDTLKHSSEGHSVFHLDLLHEFNDTHLSNFIHDFHAPSLTYPYTSHACTNSETCSFCIDEFWNIDIDIPCISLYTCHACTDFEICDFCIDAFLNTIVDSPVTHSHCTNTIDAGIIQQSDLCVQVQVATKPSFATIFPSVLQAPNWIPPFDLECNIVVYTLGAVLSSYEFDFLPP
ncbi:hypothetical protein Lal_00014155 [Lupinus albus]|nr:hypothetical protein Lal_00014155 [Lupinus albus]